MSAIGDFAVKVMQIYSKRITDEIFLMIQNDKDLMHEYLRLVGDNGLDPVNRLIGKKVKEHFGLDNSITRNIEPKSTLIQSHQEFE